ncbi:MAG: helix-turn-helix domain-containing protein [Planctomycetaceae bacterium]|nr:helix-turn-helix domain-containing protein [Planctomycetaceae bacterium]
MTNDYQRIAASIQRLQSDFRNQPSLSELAEAADLSPHHFQRLFVRWAGVSPKKFLQCLTVQAARQRLEAGASVLDAALDSGLSGPGRLHDLTVRLEAASPGEIKTGGAGWTIGFGFGDSPFGTCFMAAGPRGILRLAFVDDADTDTATQSLLQDWPGAKLCHDDVAAQTRINHIFASSDRRATLSCLRGAPAGRW